MATDSRTCTKYTTTADERGDSMPQTNQIGKHKTDVRETTNDMGHTVIEVQYHNTVVVKYNKDKGHAVLNSGGWRTATTKRRMNQASNEYGLGFTVMQRDYTWYVSLPNGDTVAFEDGMEVQTR